MVKYTIQDIKCWMTTFGAPGWLYDHLTHRNLDEAVILQGSDDDEEEDETDDPKPDGIADIASDFDPIGYERVRLMRKEKRKHGGYVPFDYRDVRFPLKH